MIGENHVWGMGYATEAINLLSGYAFGILNLHKLTAGMYAINPQGPRAFEKAGFSRGLRKGHLYCKGTYVDVILMGLVRNDA